ncbi:GntR family transcriptional regulator [Actinoplanes sp. CA-054009]
MSIGYRELAALLRRAIHRGDFPEGGTLPRQEEIAQAHGVNIKTVRQAVRLLETEGLVTAVRRRGTVVRPRVPMKRLGIDRYAKSKWKSGVVAFAADREATGRAWKRGDQTNEVRMVAADAETASALGITLGDAVYERARLVKEADVPTHTLTSYYRPEDVEGTILVDPAPGPAGRGGGFAVLTERGLEPARITESVQARMPTPEEIQLLRLPAGEPVMILHRTTFTSAGRPVEFARGVHAASRFTWSYSFEIPD